MTSEPSGFKAAEKEAARPGMPRTWGSAWSPITPSLPSVHIAASWTGSAGPIACSPPAAVERDWG